MEYEKYTTDDFIKQCMDRGYASKQDKKYVIEWCKNHPKEYYVDDDLIELYRHLEAPKIGWDIPNSNWRRTYGGHRTTKHYYDYDDE